MTRKLTYKQKCDFYNYLCSFVTDERKLRFEEVAGKRTRFITVVLEDIFQPHNASAVLRTCDCFGVQDVHIIENKNEYHINPDVALGSSNWLTLHNYNDKDHNTLDCIKNLKKQGYSIAATTLHEKSISLEEIDMNKKTAFLFGTEKNGLSAIALEQADCRIKIPMKGFTESFNISVSAAIILYSVTEKLRKSGIPWQLSDEELIDIKIDWVRNSVRESELLEKQYFQQFL
jgi:tRNA (guanosine-2'-O-)-methyltransferase